VSTRRVLRTIISITCAQGGRRIPLHGNDSYSETTGEETVNANDLRLYSREAWIKANASD